MRPRWSAAIAGLTLVVVLGGCSDTDSTAEPDDAPSTSSGGASDTADQGAGEDAAGDSFDEAVSAPAEDSLYPDVGDPSVDSLHYDLVLEWDPEGRTLTGEEELTFRSTGDTDRVRLDLSGALEVSTVELDGEKASYEHTGKDLVVSGDFAEDEHYELAIAYAGTPEPVAAPTTRADFSTTGFTIAPDGSAWTMQEPYGAHTWYAVNDHPSDKAFYDFTLRSPAPMRGVANGELVSEESVNGTSIMAWHLDSKTSPYLVTVAFGDYDMSVDQSASGVPISYWVPASSSHYLDELRFAPEALAWVEDKLGPYPWSSLGILLVPSQSGMETQTMITLGATDYATSKGVIVHEIVHQWYGDQVTPSDWSDLWMNEGMTMYLQFAWQADDTGASLEEILRQAARSERRSRRVNGPPADYDPATFGEIQVYYGPALMWDEVRERVGDDVFWEMVRAWPSHDPDGSSNRDDYLAWVEEQTGTELSDLFDGWLLGKRSPRFE